ncbi:Asp-tRNA(Asn)/Glu-tRNA(Gln) amidotransferase subunit GatC [Alicyclobacillus sp. SO9]|uniref:Asp-tRNA(Asn)/Glu-tRNA(Gln) amidotransferase subunit GatC n=1 Tax=Alicyclobacillus sp. SO9 TaxID=2665646 RepID=UPI0018E81AF5|nr:Asp-tRNA(Asn)/Glu-tRNA(Gln) amidotransferase subunit GatC [Alicyclobacillus sp. SO9]QQE79967.1 Asp-tRNA(Asn)/Glu-tRNA(Gln) amidotransferase subunit GatC [Alicyclobacillus sp. SO9]
MRQILRGGIPLKITEETVKHVAKLARLELSDEEAHVFTPQLSKILDYAEQLQQLDLADVEATSHPFAQYNVLRKDEPRPSAQRDIMLACAADEDGEHVRVPAVLEG